MVRLGAFRGQSGKLLAAVRVLCLGAGRFPRIRASRTGGEAAGR